MVAMGRPSDQPNAAPAYGRLMAASALCMVLFGGVQVLPAVCLDALGRDLGLDYTQRGFLVSLRMAMLTVALLAVGPLAERPVKRYFMTVGLIAIAVGQVLTAAVHTYGQLLQVTVLTGLGFGVVEALINPLVAQLNPARSARALNLMNGLFSLGLVAGAWSTGELLQRGCGWRLAFAAWAAPPLVCAVLYLTPRYPQPPRPVEGGRAGSATGFVRRPLFWLLMVAMVLGGGCEAGLTSWAPNYMASVLSASPREGAAATMLYGGFMALGRLASGVVVVRLGALRLLLVSAVLCALATSGLLGANTVAGAWTLFALGGLFVACFWPTLLAVASDYLACGSTTLFAFLSAAGVTGCIVVPWLIGALGDACGLRWAMTVLPATMICLAVLLLGGSRWMRAQVPWSPTTPDGVA